MVLSLEFELFFTLFPFTFTFSVHLCLRSKFVRENARNEQTKSVVNEPTASSPLVQSALKLIVGL